MKKKYSIKINSCDKNAKYCKYTYSYNRTKDIEFSICQKNAYIVFHQDSKRNLESVLEGKDRLFNDFIKKAMLIHQILYGEELIVEEKIQLFAGDEKLFDLEENPIYSLMIPNRKIEIPKSWYSLIERILNTCLTNEKEEDIVIKNAIMAKNEDKQSLKFLYNWMAMNGLYKRVASIAIGLYSNDNEVDYCGFKTEKEKIELLAYIYFDKYLDIKQESDEGKQLFIKSQTLLQKLDANSSLNFKTLNDSDNLVNKTLLDFHKYDNKGYTCGCLILLWLPYYIRCKYFHSDISMPIYAHKNECIIKILKIVNYVIENFLDENIPVWCAEKVDIRYLDKIKSCTQKGKGKGGKINISIKKNTAN